MIKLKNIMINGDIAKCDIFLEDSNDSGVLEVNLKTKDIINYSLPLGYEWCENHINHARDYLCSIKNEDYSKEKLIMWV